MKVVVLAGGTGGAKLAAGFAAELAPSRVTVIANTGDDEEFWGLLVCPDVDAVIYRLAGVFNEAAGYGQKDETFEALDALARLGEPAWFRIGDRDFATHLLRSRLIASGATLTEATLELCRRFGVESRVVPMTDGRVRTRFLTAKGNLSFQEYFVRERLQPALEAIAFDGLEAARPSPAAVAAMDEADLVVIGPSNPLISVDPIVHVVRQVVRRERTIVVSPIVAGSALKGPTVEMMRAVGLEPSPVEVARRYRDIASVFVLDEVDRALQPPISNLGYEVMLARTVMDDGGRRLAATLVRSGVR
ncbi:MAG TPA: 2-phospho-L-lactate transferase [Candidatus Dormibacteraeota bacterium]|nr:2-phospho-L-lactate transferase [Candidatus Dormibacteraeota bacterium]